jgi:hypothetical protein
VIFVAGGNTSGSMWQAPTYKNVPTLKSKIMLVQTVEAPLLLVSPTYAKTVEVISATVGDAHPTSSRFIMKLGQMSVLLSSMKNPKPYISGIF